MKFQHKPDIIQARLFNTEIATKYIRNSFRSFYLQKLQRSSMELKRSLMFKMNSQLNRIYTWMLSEEK